MAVCKCFKLVKGTPTCVFVSLYFKKKKKENFLCSFVVSIIQIRTRDDYTCLIMLTYIGRKSIANKFV
jgi:hypothetical protein